MKIKIEMEIKRDGNMGVGVGECVPNEAWLMKHAEAIAKEYSERVMSGKSELPEEIEVDLDEDEDEDSDLEPCDQCGACYPENELTDGLCEGCLAENEARAELEAELEEAEAELEEAEAELEEAEAELEEAQDEVDRLRAKLSR